MRPRRVWWFWYGVVAWLLVLTHYYALLWLPATAAVVLIAENRRQAFRRWLVTHALLGVALVPAYVFLIHPHSATGPKLWLREIWTGYPPALAMLRSLWAQGVARERRSCSECNTYTCLHSEPAPRSL